MDDAIVTATSLLREVNPVVRFYRALTLYAIVVAVTVTLILAPTNWLVYLTTILIGANLLYISVLAEEAIVKWKERTTTS